MASATIVGSIDQQRHDFEDHLLAGLIGWIFEGGIEVGAVCS
jgi:hypothetical protein